MSRLGPQLRSSALSKLILPEKSCIIPMILLNLLLTAQSWLSTMSPHWPGLQDLGDPLCCHPSPWLSSLLPCSMLPPAKTLGKHTSFCILRAQSIVYLASNSTPGIRMTYSVCCCCSQTFSLIKKKSLLNNYPPLFSLMFLKGKNKFSN